MMLKNLINLFLLKKKTKVDRKFLVLSVLGDTNCAQKWLSSNNRSYDVAVVCDRKIKSDYWFDSPGPKWQTISRVLKIIDWKKYDAIWCPDDSILADPYQIDYMFETFSSEQLFLAQPSHASDSNFELPIVENKEGLKLRYTTVVEQSNPIFSTIILDNLIKSFDDTITGWGLDWVWPKLLNYEKCGIIDAVKFKNVKPIEETFSFKIAKSRSVDPYDEREELLNRHDVSVCVCVEFESVGIPPTIADGFGLPKMPDLSRYKHISRLPRRACSRGSYVGARLLDLRKINR